MGNPAYGTLRVIVKDDNDNDKTREGDVWLDSDGSIGWVLVIRWENCILQWYIYPRKTIELHIVKQRYFGF